MAEAPAESRLRQPAFSGALSAERVAAHNARRLGSRVLLTNDSGGFAVLSPADYERYLAGSLPEGEALSQELEEKDFLRHRHDFRHLARRWSEKNLLDWKGPNVHTVVVTLRCNYKCVYCHASVVDPSRVDKDMSVETARRVVDLIFEGPSPTLMIEFQGGEPLLNWPVVKFVVDYARQKNRARKKALHFGLISNFTLLDEEKLDWLIGRGVSFCTSLDGPADLHNKNRVYLGGSSHEDVVRGLRRVQERRAAGAKVDAPNAICTVTRQSFGREKEIVDQLVELGIERVQLGPLDPIGYARRAWDVVGYEPQEFVDSYARALDHIIARSAAGAKVYEKMALIFLIRILEGGHWRFPNADVLCRLAYNYDGGVYTCEEGRLLANEGDEFFKLGEAGRTSYAELFDHPTARASLLAALPAAQPQCSQCAYSPYCTVLPVLNYRMQGSLAGQMPSNAWCGKMMGIFDVIFERLQHAATRKTLESWLQFRDR